MMKDSCCAQQSDYLKETIPRISGVQLNTFFERQSTYSYPRTVSILTVPELKILERVCFNYSLGETPLNQTDYVQLLAIISKDDSKSQTNIATVLRSLVEYFYKDRKLYFFLTKDLEFCLERRIFKNSAAYQQDIEPHIQDNEQYNKDIGNINLLDFLIQFGMVTGILPDNHEKVEQLIQNAIANLYLNNVPKHLNPQGNNKRQTLLGELGSQDEGGSMESNSLMFQDLQRTMIKNGLDKLLEDNRLQNNGNYNQLNYMGLEANETLDLVQHQFSPIIIQNKPAFSSTKQTDHFNYIHSNFFNKLSTPSQRHQTTINQVMSNGNLNPQFSFMNHLRSDKQEGFKKVNESMISVNHSQVNTPLIQNFKHQTLYPYNTEQKQNGANKSLIFTQPVTQSPFKNDQAYNNTRPQQRIASRPELMRKCILTDISSTPIGEKRLAQAFKDVDIPNEFYMTPPQKRLKINDSQSAAIMQQNKQQNQSDSDDDPEANDNNGDLNNSVSRKKRGLKILSVKVQELVQNSLKTTYKDVANELIEQLKKNSEMQELTGLNEEISDGDDEEEDSSLDTKFPSKKSKNGASDKKSQLQKWEKNVRRRVYDALNVLYAAGVLKKEGKHVFCDDKAIQLCKKSKEYHLKSGTNKIQSQHINSIVQDQQLQQCVEKLRAQVEQIKSRVEEKRETLADSVKHYLSYKQLIQRNQVLEQTTQINKNRVLSLPFILVSTKDSSDNEVDITYEQQMTILSIAFKMPFKCFGDADTLLQLGMYKVDNQFYHSVVPQSNQILKFERELKAKLAQKSTVHSTEESTLLKAFKYFDLDNNGTCEPEEFAKALEKLGVVIPSKKDLDNLFKYYDTDGSGALDYKEFSAVITGSAQQESRPERQNAVYGQGLGTRPQTTVGGGNINEVIEKVRVKLASRGARGIIGMGKQFKIFDDDNSRSLDQYEFKKAMTEQRLGLSDQEILALFNTFDRNRDGSVDYDEFVRVLRGPMSNFRKKLVLQAYNKIDRDKNGYVDIEDLKGVYNASRHPDVIQGKKTEEEILYEFLQTFQMHHNTINTTAPDNIVTQEEFEEYYNNISSSIDNDQYFELMINNAWKINEGDRTYQKGWAAEGNSKPGSQSYGQKPQTGAGRTQEPDRFQTSSKGYGQAPVQKGTSVYTQNSTRQGMENALNKLRTKLQSRGARGFIGMQKQFKIIDDNNSGTIDQQEFKKAIKDFKVELNDQEIRDVFTYFDRDSSGSIDYDEFVRGVRGPMNSFRQNIVKAAFKKLDKDGSGVIDINDIKGVYNARNHPEVKSGKKSEDDILGEFLDTFEQHHALNGGGVRDRSVTMEEFLEYYNNVSASIDNDQYFELMMVNAWKLHGEATRKPAWTNVQKDQNVYKQGFSVTKSAPFGVDSTPTDYSTNLRPSTQQQQYQTQPSAGSSSWTVKQEGTISGSSRAQNPQQNMSYSEQQLMELFSSKLAARGARGIIGLQKQFKIADDDRSHDLDSYEFKKAIKDFRIPIQEKDIDRLFNIFDRDRSGRIDYDEFLRGVRGEMNQYRRKLAEKAFRIMDKDKSGVLNIEDIKGVYNGKMHPDVKAGKKTEEEVLGEFLDTFEAHYSLSHENSRDRQITLDEWMEYYNNVSMSIDDDKYFELMMNSAWNLDGSRVNKKGWGGEV